jgi:hypothetical protein
MCVFVLGFLVLMAILDKTYMINGYSVDVLILFVIVLILIPDSNNRNI